MALTFWVLLLGGYQLYAWRSEPTPVEAVRVLVGFMENGVAGAIVFLAVYTVRPLILFPASVLTVGGRGLRVRSDSRRGPDGRRLQHLRHGRLPGGTLLRGESGPIGRRRPALHGAAAREQLRDGAHDALRLRALRPRELPGGVSASRPFILATALGSLPGTVAFVLLGASFETNFSTGTMAFNPPVLVAAAAIFVLGIAASRYFKRRERRGAGLHRGNRVKTRVCPEGGERGE